MEKGSNFHSSRVDLLDYIQELDCMRRKDSTKKGEEEEKKKNRNEDPPECIKVVFQWIML